MATKSRIPIRVTQQSSRTLTAHTSTGSVIPGSHILVEPGSVESCKIGPPELLVVKTASSHEPEKRREAAMGAKSSTRSLKVKVLSSSRPHSRNEGQLKPAPAKPAKAGQLKVTEVKAPLTVRPKVDESSSKKHALSWKTFEPDQLEDPEKKLSKTIPVETRKIQRARDITRGAKPRGMHIGAKQLPLTSRPAAVQPPAPPLQSMSSLVMQQQALGIAFETDEGALNSILTCRGVTAPLLDRTASLNVPTGVHPQSQGLRTGGSTFGARASVYATCESRYNLRDGLIQWKPTLESKHCPEHTESLVPVATPFRESCYRNRYKVAERNSVYVKYVTEEEFRNQNLSRMVQPTPGRSTIATPARVRLATNKQPMLETPFLVDQLSDVAQTANARSLTRSWRDIFTQRKGDHASLHSSTQQAEMHDDLRRTLTFVESETEGPARDAISSITDSDRTAAERAAAATTCRLSEADEELIGIEEIERRLQLEIEAMERAKTADAERMVEMLGFSAGPSAAAASSDERVAAAADAVARFCCPPRASTERPFDRSSSASLLLDALQHLSMGSSPELPATMRSSEPERHVLPDVASLAARSGQGGSAPEAWPPASTSLLLSVKAADDEPAAATAAREAVQPAGGRLTPAEPLQSPRFQPCERPHAAVAETDCSATAAVAPDSHAADLPTEMEVDHQGVHGIRQTDVLHAGDGSGGGEPPRSPLESESLRSQSRFIAAIDRLGGGGSSNSAAARASSEEAPFWEPMAQESCRSGPPATAAAAAAAPDSWQCRAGLAISVGGGAVTSGWCRWAATLSPSVASGWTPLVSARFAASVPASSCPALLEAEQEAERDVEAWHTPVFRQRAGTISVLDCGAYSPGAAGTGAGTAAGEADGTDRIRWRGPVQQQLTAVPPGGGEPFEADRPESSGTILPPPPQPLTSTSYTGSPWLQPIAGRHGDDACGRQPVGCAVDEATHRVSDQQTMAVYGVGAAHCLASAAADRGSGRVLPLQSLASTAATIVEARPCLDGGAAASPPSAFVRTVGSGAADEARLRPSLSGSALAPLSQQQHTPIAMALDSVPGIVAVDSSALTPGTASVTMSTASSTPELLYQLSLMGLLINAAERFESVLVNEECALYLCRASTRLKQQQHSPFARSELPDPVAISLTLGDDKHFIPIRKTDSEDSLSTSSHEGSAFRCYTP